MPRRERIPVEIKKVIVRMCKVGQLSEAEAARRCGVDKSSIRQWMARERSEGLSRLESDDPRLILPTTTPDGFSTISVF